MLAVLNRYRLLFIILSAILLAFLIWLAFTLLNNDKVPSRGVFVLSGFIEGRIAEGRLL